MTLVVDASVALKWVLDEGDAARAGSLIGAEPLVAPDFLLLETANVLAREVRRGALTEAASHQGWRLVADGVRVVPSAAHIPQAHRLALALGASAYDCLYLAVALSESVALLTADARFARAAADGGHGGQVKVL